MAARHLKHFGADRVECVYPLMEDQSERARAKLSSSHYGDLVHQAAASGVRFVDSRTLSADGAGEDLGDLVILDCLFGFSFRGAPREPYAAIIRALARARGRGAKILACDVPSGWPVDGAPRASAPADGGASYAPDALISLTAPKLCAAALPPGARHFLGGRFLPAAVALEFGLQTVPFPALGEQIVELLPPPR